MTDITGTEREHTILLQMQHWGQQAESLCQVLTKDSTVLVYGRLRILERADWDGNRRASVELTASDVEILQETGGNI